MKPAIVLGLALAAKAMTADNELGITQQIAQMPFDQIAFDDAADDEFAVKYVHLPTVPAPEYVAYDEVADDELAIAQQIIQLPADHAFDDAADDEFAVKYVHLPSVPVLEHVAYDEVADDELAIVQQIIQLPEGHAFDDADDEFAVKYVHLPTAEPVAFDDADDEFLAVNQPQKKPFEESKHAILCRNYPDHPFCGGHKRPLVKPSQADDEELFYLPGYQGVPGQRIQDIAHRDDEFYVPVVLVDDADDEFAVKYVHFPTAPAPEVVAYDEVADDEYYVPVVLVDDADDEFAINQQVIQLPEGHAFDDADDELSLMPVNPKFANIDWKKFAVNKPAVMPPMEALLRDDADDELFANGMRIQDIARDDEADDELVYLGQLIRDGGYIPRPYFDDEFRAEKSGKSSQEKTQKTEGPKNKRKFRPVVDETPVYQK